MGGGGRGGGGGGAWGSSAPNNHSTYDHEDNTTHIKKGNWERQMTSHNINFKNDVNLLLTNVTQINFFY